MNNKAIKQMNKGTKKQSCFIALLFSCSFEKGFTLIELLLYISMSATILLSISIFLSNLLQSRIKNQTIVEVEQQGSQVMQLITQTIRNADSITSPIQGAIAVSLVLDDSGTAITFDLAGDAIRITEGAGSPVSLISSQLQASGLSFYNLSRSGTSGSIRVQFTLAHVNNEGRNEYNYSRTFYGSASLRQ